MDLVSDTFNDLLRQVILDNLDGNFLFVNLIKAKLDLAGESITNGLNDLVVSNELRHICLICFVK